MKHRVVAPALVMLAALAACKPAALGLCTEATASKCRAGSYCNVKAGGICTRDADPPSVSVSVPAAPDAINGWVPRTADSLEVRAQVDDGLGSGVDSALLSFDA